MDQACRNFAERRHRLPILADDHRTRALHQLFRAPRGQMDQGKPIPHFFQTIFHGDTCHTSSFGSPRQMSGAR